MASETSSRPDLSSALVTTLARDLYGLHVQSVKELDSFEDRNYHIMVDVDNFNNDFIEEVCVHGYVLKVLNSEDSADSRATDFKNAVTQHVHSKGIITSPPVATIHGKLAVVCSFDRKGGQQCYEVVTGNHTTQYAVRMLEYIPGITLATVPLTPHLCFQLGQHAALLDEALQHFDDSNYPNMCMKWALENAPSVRSLLYTVKDPDTKRVVSDVIEEFEARVLKSEDKQNFRAGIIHNDLTDYNILIKAVEKADAASSRCPSSLNRTIPKNEQSSTPTFASSQTSSDTSDLSPEGDKWNVCGILDFGDVTKSYLMLELAIAMTHVMTKCPQSYEPIGFVGHILAGYLSKTQLSKQEVQLLPLAMCARFCHTFVCGSEVLAKDPANEYALEHIIPLERCLLSLRATPRDFIHDTWKTVVNTWNVKYPEQTDQKDFFSDRKSQIK